MWLGWWAQGLHVAPHKRAGEKDERWTPQLFCSAEASFPTSHLLLHVLHLPGHLTGPGFSGCAVCCSSPGAEAAQHGAGSKVLEPGSDLHSTPYWLCDQRHLVVSPLVPQCLRPENRHKQHSPHTTLRRVHERRYLKHWK